MTEAREGIDEAVRIFVTERAKRYSQDFLDARDAAAIALRDAVLEAATQAGYRVGQVEGFHTVAPREGSEAGVALLANSDGVRVARLEQNQLKDEVAADLEFDAYAKEWVVKARGRGKSENPNHPTEKTAPASDGPPGLADEERRNPVAVVAELVVTALQKVP